ncbi:sigma-70 family RNA polymerase sigma factor [Corticimicrobacter populi]|uniref:RNA polymerase subunit sigma n=1 Tax=Corticimicrobacter populi TaxID=2175229 RepID=A0A2V1K0N3_9BURK|nr:sigma-70 family RNA polymerase sigma factor [Corticimicrobacter populi]PWF23299.1 RNA polymerase subunit sigma [Corticimicrobacter populi]
MSAPDANPLDFPAFERLYRDHHGWLRTWLHGRMGGSAEAADLAHDTFVRVLSTRRMPAMPEEGRRFLTHIAKGLLIDHWRRQDLEQAWLDTLAALPEAVAPSPETQALLLEALHRIDAMLQALPARTRRVFMLSQFDGLTYARIAAETGLSLPTVKRHMRSAFLACLSVG